VAVLRGVGSNGGGGGGGGGVQASIGLAGLNYAVTVANVTKTNQLTAKLTQSDAKVHDMQVRVRY
jgi:alkyl hydroperoxide reductase subunit AhpF